MPVLNGHTFEKLCRRYDAAINGLKILHAELEEIDDQEMNLVQLDELSQKNQQLNQAMEQLRCDQ